MNKRKRKNNKLLPLKKLKLFNPNPLPILPRDIQKEIFKWRIWQEQTEKRDYRDHKVKFCKVLRELKHVVEEAYYSCPNLNLIRAEGVKFYSKTPKTVYELKDTGDRMKCWIWARVCDCKDMAKCLDRSFKQFKRPHLSVSTI